MLLLLRAICPAALAPALLSASSYDGGAWRVRGCNGPTQLLVQSAARRLRRCAAHPPFPRSVIVHAAAAAPAPPSARIPITHCAFILSTLHTRFHSNDNALVNTECIHIHTIPPILIIPPSPSALAAAQTPPPTTPERSDNVPFDPLLGGDTNQRRTKQKSERVHHDVLVTNTHTCQPSFLLAPPSPPRLDASLCAPLPFTFPHFYSLG